MARKANMILGWEELKIFELKKESKDLAYDELAICDSKIDLLETLRDFIKTELAIEN